MQEIFEKRQNLDYNLKFQTDFVLPGVNTIYFGWHSLRYFSSNIWNVIPDEIKNSLCLDEYGYGNPVVVTVSSVELIYNT